MATSRFNGFQNSLRDVYPNLDNVLATVELTNPEQAELELYNQGSSTSVDAAEGVAYPLKTGHSLGMLGTVAAGLFLLWLLGKA